MPDSAFHCELSGHTPSELAKLEVNGMVKMPPSAKLHPHLMPSLKGEMESWFITEGMGIINVVLSGDSLPEGIYERSDIEVHSHSWRWATVEVRTSGVAGWPSNQLNGLNRGSKVILNDVADEIVGANVLWNAGNGWN